MAYTLKTRSMLPAGGVRMFPSLFLAVDRMAREMGGRRDRKAIGGIPAQVIASNLVLNKILYVENR